MKYKIKNVSKKDKEFNEGKTIIEFAYFDVDIFDDDDTLIATEKMEINGNAFNSIEEEILKVEARVKKSYDWNNLKKSIELGKVNLSAKLAAKG